MSDIDRVNVNSITESKQSNVPKYLLQSRSLLLQIVPKYLFHHPYCQKKVVCTKRSGFICTKTMNQFFVFIKIEKFRSTSVSVSSQKCNCFPWNIHFNYSTFQDININIYWHYWSCGLVTMTGTKQLNQIKSSVSILDTSSLLFGLEKVKSTSTFDFLTDSLKVIKYFFVPLVFHKQFYNLYL